MDDTHYDASLTCSLEFKLRLLLLSLCSAFILLGCSTTPVPIASFQDQPVSRLSDLAVSMEEIQTDVRMIAHHQGWRTAPEEQPGRITATRQDEEASATIEINFDRTRYSIRYLDSSGMHYQAHCPDKADSKVCISPTYNAWITALNAALAARLQY